MHLMLNIRCNAAYAFTNLQFTNNDHKQQMQKRFWISFNWFHISCIYVYIKPVLLELWLFFFFFFVVVLLLFLLFWMHWTRNISLSNIRYEVILSLCINVYVWTTSNGNAIRKNLRKQRLKKTIAFLIYRHWGVVQRCSN